MTRRAAARGLALGAVLVTTLLSNPLQSESPTASLPPMPQKILIHLTHGPEHPTRAALALAVAKAALEEGHAVSVFLAGDAVQIIRNPVLDHLAGLGTGTLRQLYDAVAAGGGRFYLSGGSSTARGVTDQDLAGKPAEFAGPTQLVRLSLEHDRMFTY